MTVIIFNGRDDRGEFSKQIYLQVTMGQNVTRTIGRGHLLYIFVTI